MTDEQRDKIAWFNRAFYAEKKLKSLKLRLKCEKDRAKSNSIHIDGMDKGKSDGRKNGTYETLMSLAESEEKYNEYLAEYNKICNEIQLAIESLNNPELESLMIYRYLCFKTWESIAELMNLSVRTVKYKHKKILDNLHSIALFCTS